MLIRNILTNIKKYDEMDIVYRSLVHHDGNQAKNNTQNEEFEKVT